jgi:hypothetical protein
MNQSKLSIIRWFISASVQLNQIHDPKHHNNKSAKHIESIQVPRPTSVVPITTSAIYATVSPAPVPVLDKRLLGFLLCVAVTYLQASGAVLAVALNHDTLG